MREPVTRAEDKAAVLNNRGYESFLWNIQNGKPMPGTQKRKRSERTIDSGSNQS